MHGAESLARVTGTTKDQNLGFSSQDSRVTSTALGVVVEDRRGRPNERLSVKGVDLIVALAQLSSTTTEDNNLLVETNGTVEGTATGGRGGTTSPRPGVGLEVSGDLEDGEVNERLLSIGTTDDNEVVTNNSG